MESKLKILRIELDELGYYQLFTPESVPLIEKLVSDLKTTTESLQKYMRIAQNAIEERDNLQVGAEPYKCDNARLLKECNELHLKLLQFAEENEKVQRDLKRQVELLKSDNRDCKLEKEKLEKKIEELEEDYLKRCDILLNIKPKNKPTLKSQSATSLRAAERKTKTFEINSAMALADQKIANLTKDLKKLKEHNLMLIQGNEMLQSQLNNRDKEIKRLNGLLEGGRPLTAIKKDCCCSKQTHSGIDALQEEIGKILHEKSNLETRLKEALGKQHEAMKRALHLAERNKLLEKEMKDIDHLALAVEAECNNSVKNSSEKVTRLQSRIHESVIQIQALERENAQLKQDKQELRAELDAVSVEKRHLQTVLETSLEEKKRLTDRINNFTIIEHDLNMEIDRLTRLSAEQRRRITELECSLVNEKVIQAQEVSESNLPVSRIESSSKRPGKISSHLSPTKINGKGKRKSFQRKESKDDSVLSKPTSDMQVPENTPLGSKCCNCHCEPCSSARHLKELLDKELEFREQQAKNCIENLRSEKEFYMKEYHRLLEQSKNVVSRSSSGNKSDKNAELLQKLADKDLKLQELENANKTLSKEKFNLITRLDSARDFPDAGLEGPCLKVNCKRTERERDLVRGDLERLEDECNTLKRKLKNLSENQNEETGKLQRRILEGEEQIFKLEQERRELVQSQSSRKNTVDTLQDQCDALKEQLRVCQSELNQQRALYTQIKALHEQTDRSLSDAQNKLAEAESELSDALDRLKKRDLDQGSVNKEVELLKNDIQILRGQLQHLDQEKDELLVSLDEKTEKLAMAELDLKSKDKAIGSLNATIAELKKKLSRTIDEGSEQDLLLRNSQSELGNLRQELDTVKKVKDGAIQENRRLQDDLSAVTCDCRDARKELELYKRQVDDLKTQLQHYVAEVKRTEDLISNKEIERNELLDQFRSLSHEANILENNNHTLENEATQSRVQLSVALDHTADLERKLENKESIIQSYEKQIADLTSQIASLEIQLRQYMTQYDKTNADLLDIRDLSVKLDNENARLRRQMRERDDHRMQIDRDVDQLRSEREMLQQTVTTGRHNVESAEKDLYDAKHETGELRLLNKDLQDDLLKLKREVQELKEKLMFTNEQLDMYQEKALEYSQQNKQLRREIANERFRRTRDSESGKDKCDCDQESSKSSSSESEPANHVESLKQCLCNKTKINQERRIRRFKSNVPEGGSPSFCKCCSAVTRVRGGGKLDIKN